MEKINRIMAVIMGAVIIVYLLIIMSALTNMAMAAQYKKAKDGAEITAHISARELTRILLEGDKIKRVVSASQVVILDHDPERGDLFIGSAFGKINEPVNLFITSALGATYQFLFTPKDTPSEQIIIRNPDFISAKAAANDKAPRKEELSSLMRAMITGETLAGFDRLGRKKLWDLPKIDNARLKVSESWIGDYWQAMIVTVKRRDSDTPLIITESQFAPAVAVWLSDKDIDDTAKAIIIRSSSSPLSGGSAQ